MTYKEKLEKYKKKLLSEEEMNEIEEEIEKVDAISEYLSEHLEEELDFGHGMHGSDAAGNILDKNAADFEKYVKKSIRRAYIKMTVGIGAVLLAIILFIQFGLSPLLDAMYYDPTERIEILSEDGERMDIYNKAALDYRTYAELTLPCKNEATLTAFSLGFGNYTISIYSDVSYGTEFAQGTAGQIRKGKLELYDPKYLDGVPGNFFVCYGLDLNSEKDYKEQMEEMTSKTFTDEDGLEYHKQLWFYDSLESARKAVEDLDENRRYLAYVSLRRDLNFTETNALMEDVIGNSVDFIAQPWLAIRNDEENYFHYGILGYNYEDVIAQTFPADYNKKYPYLSFSDSEKTYDYYEVRKNEEIMTQHIVSMCEYLGDRDAYVDMMDYGRDSSRGRFRSYAKYIREHGLNCYGFVCITTKADMLKMLENDEIIGIIPKDWQ